VGLTSVVRYLFTRSRRAPQTPRPTPAVACRPRLERLEDRAVPAALLQLAALGDSLSASYQGQPQVRSRKVEITTLAEVRATSHDVLTEQAPQAAALIAAGEIDHVSIMVGANDVFLHLPTLGLQGPEAFVSQFVTGVTSNIAATLDVLAAAGDAGVVLSNIPDVAGAPGFQAFVTETYGPFAPFIIDATAAAVDLANQQIEALAAARHIPLIDLHGLTELDDAPFEVGGVTIDDVYSPDYFHPNTLGQGLIGNTVLEALHVAYNVPRQPLRLSDQEILVLAGITAPRERPQTYFDVGAYVFFATPGKGSHGAPAGWAAA
jgi:lysophospholipase L1-like esterase